jgi:hypothetical protein
MSKGGFASGFAFGYAPTSRSVFYKIDRSTQKLTTGGMHYSMFDVGRSTCPQCLDDGVIRIQPFDLYIDVNTNQMRYAWQAGVRRSLVSYLI